MASIEKFSDDQLIRKWIDVNIEIIKELIHFYEPTIVIAGGILQYIHEKIKIQSDFCEIHNNITKTNSNPKLLSNLGYTIKHLKEDVFNDINPYKYDMASSNKKVECSENASYILPTEEGPIFIQTNHPAPKNKKDFEPETFAQTDAERIIKYWSSVSEK